MSDIHGIERRLLAAILTDVDVFAACDSLEVADFSHPHHREVFETLRNLRHRDEHFDPISICDEIQRRDFELDRNVGSWINLGWFGLLMLDTMPYPGPRTVTRLDGRTFINGIAVDWTAYLKLLAYLQDLFPGSLTVDDFTDETLQQVKSDLVAADLATLRKFRTPHMPTEQDHDRQHRREEQAEWLREQRIASNRRARRTPRKRGTRTWLSQRILGRRPARNSAA